MRNALKLVLLYFVLLQLVAPFLAAIPCALYLQLTTGTIDVQSLIQHLIVPGQFIGMVLMMVYLWKTGYLSGSKATWRVVSVPYLLWSLLLLLSCSWLLTIATSYMTWLPNVMKQTFNTLLSCWEGILLVSVVGPVFEEILFRGAITRSLLAQYSPTKAIVLSALIFGLFHINPVQIVPAFFIGLIFAWVYYRTGSLVPVIFMHVANNSIAAYVTHLYPGVDDVTTLMPCWIILFVSSLAVVVAMVAYDRMKRTSLITNHTLT